MMLGKMVVCTVIIDFNRFAKRESWNKIMIKRLIGKLKILPYFVSCKIKVDEKTGEIKLPKRKLKIVTDYYL